MATCSSGTLRTFACLSFLSVSLAAPAAFPADDAFYFDLSGGISAMTLDLNDEAVRSAIANTYWGVDARMGICSPGMFNICGGLTGFASLGSSSQSISARMGGGDTDTSMNSIGGYVQGKANLGIFTLSPFAGYRQIFGDISVSDNHGLGVKDINTGAYYAGLESSIKFWPTSLELGTRLEYGRSTKDSGLNDFEYGVGTAFLRFKF